MGFENPERERTIPPSAIQTRPRRWRERADPAEIRTEAIRKSIHLVIALIPLLATLNRTLTLILLAAGTCVYIASETLRRRGIRVPIVSALTAASARNRDSGKFILGPVTLGTGAFLSLLLFPEPAASIAIYTLAFGDSFSSLIGKTVGRIPMPFTRGKSLEGSLACFTVTFASALAITARPGPSAIVALVSTLVEGLPLKDWDNIALPLAAGITSILVYRLA
ncbi:MAG: diacylglycerol/polyprenol kinase family protein [Rectinema sp.]